MTASIRRFVILSLIGLVSIITACGEGGTTEPGPETVGATVRFLAPGVCARLDTPSDSLNMGTVEFENTSSTVSIVPKQLTVRMTARTVVGIKVWQFSPSWRNSDNSITPNIDAQTDSIASYIQFGTLSAILPGGKWRTTLKGSVPNPPTAGSYTFSIMSDSIRVKTVSGDNVTATMGVSDIVLTVKTTCP